MPEPNHQPPTIGSIAAILPAAGSGRRFGAEQNKLFADLAGRPLWVHSALRLSARPEVGRIVMPISECDRLRFEDQKANFMPDRDVEFCLGGSERSDSVAAALEQLDGDHRVRWIAVHDAARPLVRDTDLAAVFAMAEQTGAAILAAPISGTVKRTRPAKLGRPQAGCETIDRTSLFVALTPQVFSADLLRSAYARHRGFPVTDDAQLVERMGRDVALVVGSSDNVKITFPEDLAIAEAILAMSRA